MITKELTKKVLNETWTYKPGSTSGQHEILLIINGVGYALRTPVNGLDGKAEERVRQMIIGHKLLERLSKLHVDGLTTHILPIVREALKELGE